MTSPELSVVLPAWNRPDLLVACLRSLETALRRESAELILIDNGSEPPLSSVIEELVFAGGSRLIRSPRNLGFSAAANRGAACARGRRLLFLTSDVLVPEHTIARMLAALRHDPGIGAIAPLELDASGRLRSSGMRFLTPFNHALGLLGVRPHRRGAGRGRGLAPDDAQWVPAAALLTSTALFRSVGGFDEAYVFYEEDEDFCWRLQRRGYRVAICAQATIAHPGKGSASLAAHWSTLSLYRGQSIFLQRRLGSGAAIGYRFATSAALVAKSFFGKVGKQADARCAHPSVPSVLGALWLRRPVETDTKAA